MANRAKRLERELTLLEVENQFHGRFKKEKVRRKQGLRPVLILLLNATSENDFEPSIYGRKTSVHIFLLIKKMEVTNEESVRVFRQLLQYPKSVFRYLIPYLRILETLFELEVCRSLDTWSIPKSKDELVIFKSIFYHLFVKYKIPNSLDIVLKEYCYNNFDYLRFQHELLIHMVKGKGLHHFSKLSIKANSKVNFHFFNAPTHFDLMKTIWWAAIRSKKVAPSLASKIIHSFDDIYTYTGWYEWMDDLIFFLNRFKDINPKDLKNILEFFISQKKDEFYIDLPALEDRVEVSALYPDFKLKGRSVASVLRFCEEWKRYINLIKGMGDGKDFKKSTIQPFRIYNGKTLVTIKQIRNVKELFKEGKQMSHCVGTYAGKCVKASSSIWTMKLHLPNKKVKKALTIEILENEKSINEALGKGNRPSTDLENKWLKAWAAREELKCEWN